MLFRQAGIFHTDYASDRALFPIAATAPSSSERSLDQGARGPHHAHDVGLAASAHGAQANRRGDEESRRKKHDKRETGRDEGCGVQELEELREDFPLTCALHAGHPRHSVGHHLELFGILQLDPETRLHLIGRDETGERSLSASL